MYLKTKIKGKGFKFYKERKKKQFSISRMTEEICNFKIRAPL